jgi:hypothetical protein
MFFVLQVLAVFLVSVAWALSLAHALELPGKMRLDKQAYLATQRIYYPGFTIGAGFGEGGGMMSTLALMLLTPRDGPELAWTIAAFVALLAMHLAYWVVTHPVNKLWLRGQELTGFAGGFIRFDPARRSEPAAAGDDDWIVYRRRWEYSHVLRAALAGCSFVCLVIAVAL